MRNIFLRWDNPWLWAIFFFIIFLAVNCLLFYSYQQSAPEGNIWVQIWNYCGTEAFRAVTIGLMIPVILAIIGGIFKIRNAIEERIRSTQDQRTEQRWDCVKLTEKLWNDVYSLTSEVRHFKSGADDEARIKEILTRLENLDSSGEDIVNAWHFRFRNLSEDDMRYLVEFMNILLHSASTVAYRIIRDGGNKKEISELQNSLGVIQDEVKTIAHHPMLNVLKYSVDVKRHDLSEEEKEKAESEITARLKHLKYWAEQFKSMEEKYNTELLPAIDKKKVEEVVAFREAAGELKDWRRANPLPQKPEERTKILSKCQELKNFNKAFNKIGCEEFVSAWEIEYSEEYLKELALWLGFNAMYRKIEDMATWPKE